MRVAIAFLLSLLAVSHTALAADDGGWGFIMPGGPRGALAVQNGSLDSIDSSDVVAQPYGGWIGGTHYPSDFYAYDFRAPLAYGETKTWIVYFWAIPGTTPADRLLHWVISTGYPLPADMETRLEYIQKPQGVVGGPAVGTVWTTPPSITLPFYATSDGLTGHAFMFTLTMIPEPSPLLAFSTGVAGLGGFMLSRKLRQRLAACLRARD